MMNTIITTLLSVVMTVLSGTILFLLTRFLAKQQEKQAKLEKAKTEENVLILQFLNALGKLSVANCLALRDGTSGTNINEALRDFEIADKHLYDYIVNAHASYSNKND